MTEQFNFGGGLFEKKTDSADPNADPDRHRSKKEVWHQLHAIKLLQCHVHGTQCWPVMCALSFLSFQNTTISFPCNMHQKLHTAGCVCSVGQISKHDCSEASHLSHDVVTAI